MLNRKTELKHVIKQKRQGKKKLKKRQITEINRNVTELYRSYYQERCGGMEFSCTDNRRLKQQTTLKNNLSSSFKPQYILKQAIPSNTIRE